MKIVLKFGGTSVGSGKKIVNVCEIVQKVKKNNQVIVVSSALQSTTDELLELSENAKKGQVNKKIINDIVQRHQDAIKDIIQDKKIQDEVFEEVSNLIKDLEKTVEGVIIVKELSDKTRDKIVSFGERLAVPIISAKLRDMGIKSESFTGGEVGIMTDENFGNASPLMKVTQHNVKNNLSNLLEETVPVITGFIGATQQGDISTIGRG